MSKQEATVRALTETAARRAHEAPVRDASQRAAAKYAGLLERLARA